jgi:translation initiation factor 6 (eIF-6)
MKLDSVTAKVMSRLAQEHNIPIERVLDIVKAYYESIHHIGQTANSGVLIHVKNLGKIVYSTRQEEEVKKLQENYQLLKGL